MTQPPTYAEFDKAVDDADRFDCHCRVRDIAKWIEAETWPKRMAAQRQELERRIAELETMFRDGTRASTMAAYTFALAEMVKHASVALQPGKAAARAASAKGKGSTYLATVERYMAEGCSKTAAVNRAAADLGVDPGTIWRAFRK